MRALLRLYGAHNRMSIVEVAITHRKVTVLSRLWCVAERESSLRARHHNRIQQPLNDAQMLAAWLLSIKGAHNWDSSYAPARNGKCVNAARDESTVVVNKEYRANSLT